MKIDVSNWSSIKFRHFSMVMISLALVLWSISIFLSKMVIGDYGLINGINPLFFVSISLLSISFFISIKKNSEDTFILVLHLLILIFCISSLPLLLEQTPRFPYNLQSSLNIDYILQNGHSNPDVIHYESWPGIFYLGAIFNHITSISPVNLILLLAMVFEIINTSLFYLLYSTFLDKKQTFAAFLLSNTLFFSSPVYLVPGVLGTMMIIFAITVLLRSQLLENRYNWGFGVIFIIFTATAVIAHYLSSIVLIAVLITFFILSYLFKKSPKTSFILVIVMFFTWQLYLAGTYSMTIFGQSLQSSFNFDQTVSQASTLGFGGSAAHTQVVIIRFISALILVSLAAIAFIDEILIKRKINFKNLLIPTWIGANTSMTFLTSYSGEIIGRSFSLSTNLLHMMASKLIDNKRLSYLLLIIILISPPLSIINAFGNEQVDYVSPEEIDGANFLYDHVSNLSTISSFNIRVWAMRYSELLDYNQLQLNTTINANKTNYILIGERDINNYFFIFGVSDIKNLTELENSSNFNKIYQSQGFTLLKGDK